MSRHYDMVIDKGFVCTRPMPGVYCSLIEVIILGVFFYISALFSLFFLQLNIRKHKCKHFKFLDQTTLFWLFLFLWQIYRGTICIATFDWDWKSYKIFYVGLNHIFQFIPMSLTILIIFDLLFTYRNPGSNAIRFFTSIFILIIVTFVCLGMTLALIDLENDDSDISLSLWCACSDFIIACMFILPSRQLIKAVTYPIVQPEDKGCINFCTIGQYFVFFIFIGRMLWNFCHFFEINKLQDLVNEQIEKSYDTPTIGLRISNFFFYLLVDFVPSTLALITVCLIKKHDSMFNDNVYYTRSD